MKIGGFDTVYKEIGDTLSFLGVSSGNFVSNSNVLSKQGFGTSSAGSFHLRRANSVRYESPTYQGLQGLVQYSPDEAKTASRNAYLWSLGVVYDSADDLRRARVRAAQRHVRRIAQRAVGTVEHQRRQRPLARHGRARNIPVPIRQSYGRGRRRTNAVRGARRQERPVRKLPAHGVQPSASIRSGATPGARRPRYDYAARAAAACSVAFRAPPSGLDGRQLSLGAAYYLSKRTYVFALYAKLWNGRSAQYNNIDGINMPPGADPQQLALGITHNF